MTINHMTVMENAAAAKDASRRLAATPLSVRNAALLGIADALYAARETIFAANARDLAAAQSLPAPLLKRLKYDAHKLDESIAELHAIAAQPDPIGRTLVSTQIADSLELYRVSCPIGVIGMVFESRPDALVQIAALCLKTGNSVLLKGGSEALETNRALFAVLNAAALDAGIPDGWAALLESREDVASMLALDEYISLLIPRGSNAFVQYIMDNTKIPVLGHAEGLCHVYMDRYNGGAAGRDEFITMATKIVRDSKLQYPAVCNAIETLLIHADIAEDALPIIAKGMSECELRGDERTRAIVDCIPASVEDWDTEYLDAILSIRVVSSLDEAIAHINRHGSGHTDAIVTLSAENATRFLNEVDSADVFWNCSTRFADGYRFGLGAEVGVSTTKIQARGPVGMDGLMTYKYKLIGAGQTVQGFADGEWTYAHTPIRKECPV
ncbi:gamma-glutamyl phosphate reductase [Clostridia bacterium]|nr:gamma-glutamyl phosphate reductase [Clostridia bacterium]